MSGTVGGSRSGEVMATLLVVYFDFAVLDSVWKLQRRGYQRVVYEHEMEGLPSQWHVSPEQTEPLSM